MSGTSTSAGATSAAMVRAGRHYGLDWLRIAAFGLLILYHIGMAFAPWTWIIHTPHRIEWLIVPMEAVSPWRLSLLFAVSGYASRHLFERGGSAERFAASRARRLLIPLAFGMAVLVPVEMWVLVRENGYPRGLMHFWAFDAWRWGPFWGREFPSWEHLWFVAYLAAYSFVLAAVLQLGGARVLRALDALADWFAAGSRLLWAPALLLVLAKLSLMFLVPEKQGLTTDWTGHAHYLPIFLFGFVLARSPQLWPAIARLWLPALALAAVGYAIDLRTEILHADNSHIGHLEMAIDRAARNLMAWGMILALFQLADRFWNRDHRWRGPLAEAVFPAYLVHHLAIVLIACGTSRAGLSAWATFALMLAGTSAACAATWLIGRRIGWLRPLIGLAPQALMARPIETPAPA